MNQKIVKKWVGFLCVILIAAFTAFNQAADGCLLTKKSFIETFCVDHTTNGDHCFEGTSIQPNGYIHWKVHFIALKSFGTVFGTMFAAKISNQYGRRITCLFGFILSSLACIGAISWPNLWFVLSTRLIMGIGNGFSIGPGVVWVSEMFMNHQNRGTILTVIPISTCCGQVLSALCVWLMNNWKLSSAMVLIPLPFVFLAVITGYFPESQEAYEIDGEKKPLIPSSSTSNESDDKKLESNKEVEEPIKEGCSSPLFTDQSLFMRLMLCCGMFVLNVLGGAAAVIVYGSSIVEDAGVSDGNLAQFIVFLFNFFGTSLNIFTGITERNGRKPLLVAGSFAMFLLLLGIPLLYLVDSTSSISNYIFASIICLFLFLNAFTVGPVKWVYVSEVFPTNVRTYAIQIVLLAEISSAFLSSYSLYMISKIGLSISFSIFALIGVMQVVIVQAFAEETSQKTFDQIDKDFRESSRKSKFPCFRLPQE